MWKILFGGLLGFGAAKLIDNAQKGKGKPSDMYKVYLGYERSRDGESEMVEAKFPEYQGETGAKGFYDMMLKGKKKVKGDFFLDEPSSYIRRGMKSSGETVKDLPKKEIADIKKQNWTLVYASVTKGKEVLDEYEKK